MTHELCKTSNSSITESMAFVFNKKSAYDIVQSHDIGHFNKKSAYEKYSNKARQSHDSEQFNRDSKRPNSYFCEHSQMSGHSVQRCYKIHGYPPPKPQH